MKDEELKLKRSIIITTISYTIFQIFFITIINLLFSSSLFFAIAPTIVNILYHGCLFIMLYKSPELFQTIPDKKQLEKVNIGNKLTLYRLSSAPNIIFIILIQENYPNNKSLLAIIILFIATVFITDFFDGAISRKRNECTRLGAIMDSSSDYLVLFVITVIFFTKGIMRKTLFFLIILRGLVILISGLGYWFHSKDKKFETTFLGKASVFATMTILVIETTKLISLPSIETTLAKSIKIGVSNFTYLAEWIVCLILVISILDKLWLYLGRIFKFMPTHPSDKKKE